MTTTTAVAVAADSNCPELVHFRIPSNRLFLRENQRKEDQKAAKKRYYEELDAKRAVTGSLMASCVASLKSSLKDPSSLQIHNRYPAALQIEYSATNSFGGRIRNVMDCKTGRNLR